MTDNEKAIEKVALYLPIEAWSEIIMTLDKMIEVVCTRYGFGNVDVSFTIHRGNIIEISYSDKISVRGTKATTPTQDTREKIPMPPITVAKATAQDAIDKK